MALKQKRNRQSLKNVPDYWDELKRVYSMTLTPTAVTNLDAMRKPPQGFASQLDISRSELVEQIGRGVIRLQLDVELPHNPIVAVSDAPHTTPSNALRSARASLAQMREPPEQPSVSNTRSARSPDGF